MTSNPTMRLETVAADQLEGRVLLLLEGVREKMGLIPNIMRVMAHAPDVLEGLISLQENLEAGMLDAKLRHEIAIAVSQANESEYCLSAYVALGRTTGLSEECINDARRGTSPKRRTDAALQFATTLVRQHGQVAERNLEMLRSAGFNEDEIVQIVAQAMVASFHNYIYHISAIALDFPAIDLKLEQI